jgi:DNA-binding LacI/PurR family transcriptional regulator
MRESTKADRLPPISVRRPASIQDVAAAAGVSTATVSRVLNSPGLVSQQTAERVQRIIGELGYRPNPYAQGLTTRRKLVVGIALPDIFGEFYSELLRGADGEARRLGYHLLVASEPKPGASEQDEVLPFGLTAGIAIMMSEPNERMWEQAHAMGLPLVVLDAEVNKPGVDSIVVDNETGTREATEHLLRTTPPDRCYFVGGPK